MADAPADAPTPDPAADPDLAGLAEAMQNSGAPSTASGAVASNDDLSGLADAMQNSVSPAAPPTAAPPAAPRAIQRLHRPVTAPGAHAASIGAPGAAPSPPEQSWDQVLAGAEKNFVPSLKGQLEPYLPQNWGSDVSGLLGLAKGVGAKTGAYSDPKDAATVDALMGYYARKYGSVAGFKEALANDPASVLTDVAAGASLPAGGEGLASKIPGAAGDIASAAARGAGAVARYTNPLGITAKAVSYVLPRATVGAFSAPVARAVRAAFPSGALDAGELATDTATVGAFRATMGSKGVSPATARESLLRRFDDPGTPLPVPTSIITGTAAPSNAAGRVADAVNAWKGRVADAATTITGASEPSPTDFGDALEQAQIGAHNQYVSAYDQVAQHQGVFDPSLAQSLPADLQTSLAGSNLPNIAAHPEFVQTRGALDWLQQHLPTVATGLTPQELMNARKTLGWFYTQASGADEAGVGKLIDAFDDHVGTAAANGLYAGADGPAVVNDMANAVASYRGYKQAFQNRTSPAAGAVASATKNLIGQQPIDPASRMIMGPAPPGSAMAAQGALTGKLINPKTLAVPAGAQALYGKLLNIMGGPTSAGGQALQDYIRQSVTRLSTDSAGNAQLLAKPDQIVQFLSSPLANVFTPQEQTTLKQIAEAHRMLTAPLAPGAKSAGMIRELAGRGVRGLVGAGIGEAAQHVIPGAGPILGAMAEQAFVEPAFASRAASKALSGAPSTGALMYGPGRLANRIFQSPQTALGAELYGAGVSAPQIPIGAAAGSQGASGAYSDADADAATRMVLAEAGNQPDEGKLAALYTALNRAAATGKPLSDVIAEPNAYEGVTNGAAAQFNPNSHAYQYVRDNIVTPALSGQLQDPTGGMTHFLNKRLQQALGRKIPDWAQGDGMQIGAHTFYKAGGGRIERAAGGRASDDVDALVERLMASAKDARGAEKKATKPLLKLPDATVAKALAVAGRGIA